RSRVKQVQAAGCTARRRWPTSPRSTLVGFGLVSDLSFSPVAEVARLPELWRVPLRAESASSAFSLSFSSSLSGASGDGNDLSKTKRYTFRVNGLFIPDISIALVVGPRSVL